MSANVLDCSTARIHTVLCKPRFRRKTIITVCILEKLVIVVGISTHICNGSLEQYVLVIILKFTISRLNSLELVKLFFII